MRAALVLVLAFAIASVAAPDSDLKALYDAHDWFALRDAVNATDAPPFYRGAVAYAFNDTEAARSNLEQVIATAPDSDDATEARGLLIYLYQRQGHFAHTLEQVRLIRKALPDAPGLKNAEALFAALSRYPEQSLVFRDRKTLRYAMKGGNLFVPVEVNNTHAEFMIDTGANFSVVSESEAKRLGLTLSESGATGTVVTGAQVSFRTALAPTVKVGGVHLRNVVFLVSPDTHQPFVSLPRGWRGALGIPVLLAIERFTWTATGDFEVGREPDRVDNTRSNLCFEGVTPVVEGAFDTKPATLVLDTGATHTDLGPRFATDFPGAMRGGTRRTRVVGGVGDRTTVESMSLPEVRLDIGGFGLRLRPASVLLTQLATDDRWFFGRLGIDALCQARAVTIDLRAMTLRLEP
jgi:predicted aspartyl protease